MGTPPSFPLDRVDDAPFPIVPVRFDTKIVEVDDLGDMQIRVERDREAHGEGQLLIADGYRSNPTTRWHTGSVAPAGASSTWLCG